MGWDNAKIEFTDGTMYNCRQWCDVICSETAEMIAIYGRDSGEG